MDWDVLLLFKLFLFHIFSKQIFLVIAEENELKIPLRYGFLEGNVYFELMEPKELSYSYKIRPAKNFGSILNTTYVEIRMVPVKPSHGCSTLEDMENELYGAIALIERGGCSFLSKTIRAEEAGALGVIIMDHDYENDQRMIDMIGDDTGRLANIPAFFLLGKDGNMIKRTLEDLQLDCAYINIPINMTGVQLHRINHPPWSYL